MFSVMIFFVLCLSAINRVIGSNSDTFVSTRLMWHVFIVAVKLGQISCIASFLFDRTTHVDKQNVSCRIAGGHSINSLLLDLLDDPASPEANKHGLA